MDFVSYRSLSAPVTLATNPTRDSVGWSSATAKLLPVKPGTARITTKSSGFIEQAAILGKKLSPVLALQHSPGMYVSQPFG